MFLTLEGIDGCGKTTQARLLSERLRRPGTTCGDVVWTKEPGGWTGGDKIRELVLRDGLEHPLSELFLFLADRCEHVLQVIAPALKEGKTVICERYTDSTLAYQSWGRGLPMERIEDLFRWCGFPSPDLTIWIDLPAPAAYHRMAGRGRMDRLEEEGTVFLEKVRSGFAFLAERDRARIVRIDGDKDIPGISAEIIDTVLAFLSRRGKERDC